MLTTTVVSTGWPPSTPGEILLEEFLKPMGITAKEFALHIYMTPAAISEIIHGRCSITSMIALKFSQAFGIACNSSSLFSG